MLRLSDFALLAARLLLAFVFLLAGAAKLVDPVGLRKAWRDFGLPAVFAPLAILLLPLAEVAVAVALVPARLSWYGAIGAMALLAAFAMAILAAMVRGRKPECRCFGRVHSAPVGWPTLFRDGFLAACAVWLITRGPARSGPEVWSWFAALNNDERKIAVLTALAVVFVFFRLLERSRPQSAPVESPSTAEEEEEESEAQPAPVSRPAPPRKPATSRRPPPEPPVTGSSAQGIGLPVGTPAPEFDLPGVTGERRSLQALRAQGHDILLVFSSPNCDPCHALAPRLARWSREMEGILNIVVVSRGSVRDNLAKLREFDASRVLLQREFEISEAYDCTSTPTAVVVGADGLIRTGLAVGREPIQQLVASYAKQERKP